MEIKQKDKICRRDGTALLMTGTIDPKRFNRNCKWNSINVKIDDANQRMEQYMSAIEFYIVNSPFKQIVFIENSGFPFDAERYRILAKENHKCFEYIYRKLDDNEIEQMLIRGKSYGEADLIDYAMRNSSIIAAADYIYKITGRVKLLNSSQILDEGGV